MKKAELQKLFKAKSTDDHDALVAKRKKSKFASLVVAKR